MKHRIVFLALAGALLASGNSRAEPNPYNGQWHATFLNARGISRDGTVIVKDEGGSWDMNAASANNPCSGRKAPIEVQKADAGELVFEVKRSKALTGCTDTLMTLKPTEAGALKGLFNDRDFTMTRRP